MPYSTKLKPCPFCGGTDIEVTHDTHSDYEMHWYWIIGCAKCDVEFSVCENETMAIEKWNTRVEEK